MEEVARFFANPAVAQQFQSFTPSAPQVLLLKQTSPTKENVSVKGITKSVHVVIKNTPFNVQLGISTPPSLQAANIDFNHLALDVKLVYDTPTLKEVDFVKSKPLVFKSSVSERGDQITLECKIRVLTSQHEDMFFRVKTKALDPRTQQEFTPPLEVYSEPIKVISKPEQLKKKPVPKKRTMNDVLMEQINKISSQLDSQHKMLSDLCDGRPSKRRKLSETEECSEYDEDEKEELEITELCVKPCVEDCKDKEADKGKGKAPDFVAAFTDFLNSYNQLAPEEKPTMVRKLMRTCSARDTERLSELVDLFASEGLQRQIGDQVTPMGHLVKSSMDSPPMFGCSCTHCPYKLELEQIESVSSSLFNPSILDGTTLERLLAPAGVSPLGPS